MGGPAFALETNLSLELDFDDMEELKAHPMASTFLVSLDQLMQGILGKDRKTVMEWKPSFDEVEKEKKEDFDKHMDTSDYCKEKKKQLDLMEMIGELFADFDSDCSVDFKAGIFNLASIEYKIEGAGYGDLVNLMYKAFTISHRQDLVNRIISDFTNAQEQPAEEVMAEGAEAAAAVGGAGSGGQTARITPSGARATAAREDPIATLSPRKLPGSRLIAARRMAAVTAIHATRQREAAKDPSSV